jgi:hypothetical protein
MRMSERQTSIFRILGIVILAAGVALFLLMLLLSKFGFL